ncbi:hypothetical protein BJ508DRAFT_180134 [Ascobolus immersus RN42]|uniref:Uncharacterized protein n=1 Tax=Ascobolus immersus RN42 TaxID=1160509 RepID=A0A3N4HY93_ASCIM|nr:hypothetical protein BJ508DRAFT_180134 [Ascobolus immersus RN42]
MTPSSTPPPPPPPAAPSTPRPPRRKLPATPHPAAGPSPLRAKQSLHDNSSPFPTSTASKLKRKRRSSSTSSVRRIAFLEHEKRGVGTAGLERGLVRQMSGLKMASPLPGEGSEMMEVEGSEGSVLEVGDQHRGKRQEGEDGLEGGDSLETTVEAAPDGFIFEKIPGQEEEEELRDVEPGFFYYKPTAAQLWARNNRRNEQIREYKLREAREAREARRERRRKEEAEAKAREGGKPRVRFAEV